MSASMSARQIWFFYKTFKKVLSKKLKTWTISIIQIKIFQNLKIFKTLKKKFFNDI